MKPFTIDRALSDRRLLGAGLGDLASWSTWLVVLKAAFGLPLDDTERETFTKVAADRHLPAHRVRELWCLTGRRAGKSRMAAAIGLYLGLFQKHALAPGEVGYVPILAASRDQAENVFAYIKGFVETSAALRGEVVSSRSNLNSTEIKFKGNVTIGVHTASFRTVRGRTIIGAVFDETSFWRDETSSNPDVEVYRAVLPALIASGGMLVSISTPYRKLGLMHSKHRDHFGIDGDDVLVVQGTTAAFNPLIDQREIEAAYSDDPEAAPSEWGGVFRDDISSFLDDKLIDAAVDHGRPLELPPRPRLRYSAFADPSGGRGDAFTLCIGHSEGDRFIADVVRGVSPPFDPASVVSTYAALLKDYAGVREVRGDNYSAEWVSTTFEGAGIKYLRAEKAKSQLYLEALPLFTRGLISIPDHPRLLRELRLLERRTHRSGKDTVDHGRSGSDDLANALVGAAVHAAVDDKDRYYASLAWVTSDRHYPQIRGY